MGKEDSWIKDVRFHQVADSESTPFEEQVFLIRVSFIYAQTIENEHSIEMSALSSFEILIET